MRVDLEGRIANTKLSANNCLLPVFEAVINSIHAIHDAKEKNGKITIRIERDAAQGVLKPELQVSPSNIALKISSTTLPRE
jgi:hypothetical protein